MYPGVPCLPDTVTKKEPEPIESQIAALLEARFGDGLMYLSKNNSQSLYKKAIEMGFIDSEGYLTRKGRSLLTHHRFH